MIQSAAMGLGTSAGRRPRVLWIGTDLPWPLDSGFRIRAFENLRALSEFAYVTVACLAEPPGIDDRAVELAAALPDSGVILPPVAHDIHIRRNPAKLARAFISGVSRGLPYKVAKFRSAALEETLIAAAKGAWVDTIHVELATFPYARLVASVALGPCRVVLDEHNVESQLLLEHCASRSFGVLTPIAYLEALRTRAFEREIAGDADMVFLISERDRESIESLTGAGGAHTCVVPPVVEAARITRTWDRTREVESRPVLTFVGQMSWMPNEEAMRFFADEVLPLVRQTGADPRVLVVGGGVSPSLEQHLATVGVEALGYVDDLADVYAITDVFIAPFAGGGGVRIKLLDAMSAGLPVVTTTAGAKGLESAVDSALLVADGAEEFSHAVCLVLDDAATARRLSDGGRDYLERHHSRASAIELMRAAYGSVLGDQPPAEHPMELEVAS